MEYQVPELTLGAKVLENIILKEDQEKLGKFNTLLNQAASCKLKTSRKEPEGWCK